MRKKTASDVLRGREFISTKEVSERWQCSPSSVERIARRAKLTRIHLGEGKNGMVRYVRKEVEAYEESRRMRMS